MPQSPQDLAYVPSYKKTQFTKHLSKDTSLTALKELIEILQEYKNNNFISETEYAQLRLMATILQQQDFMVFPKSTKQHAYVPIVSACDTATYNTAKFITTNLQITVAILHLLLKIAQI